MNNLNTLNGVDAHQKKSYNFSRFPYILAISTMLSITNPTEVKANNITDSSLQNVEVVQIYDIIDNIQKRTGVILPSIYTQKFKNFVSNSKILKDNDALKFTEDFIVKQMESDWGISKQNQLLFIWDSVYEQITSNNIYTGEDGNDTRLREFENVMDTMEQCGKNYNSGFKAYMRQKSADADKRISDADKRISDADKRISDADKRISDADKRISDARQQSADAIRETMKADSLGLKELVKYYNLCMKNPETNDEDEMLSVRNAAKEIIKNCKKYGINYEDVMMKEIKKTDRLNDADAREKVDMILMWVEGPDFADKKEKGREPSTNHYEIIGNDSKPDSI